MRKMMMVVMVVVSGCTGTQAMQGAELTCEVVRKICTVAGAGCAMVPTSGDENTR